MRFFFTAFGLHNPYVLRSLPEHAVYPISAAVEGGVDLDYSSLLVANSYVIDERAFEFITSGEKPFLAPMARTLKTLRSEGLLHIEDFGKIVAGHSDLLRSKTEALLGDPTAWLPIARQQWKIVGPEFDEFQKRYGLPENKTINTAHFGIVNYLLSRDGGLEPEEIDRLSKLLFFGKRSFNRAEQEELRSILRPLVAQVLINELIRQQLAAPFLDWDDAKAFYDNLYLGRWSDDAQDIEVRLRAKKLLELVIPQLKPNNIDAVIRFVQNNRAVESFRAELQQTIELGETIDEKWLNSYLDAAVKRNLTVRAHMKRFRWLGAVVGTMLPGGNLLQEFFTNLAAEAAENRATDAIEQRGVHRYAWYYALQQDALIQQGWWQRIRSAWPGAKSDRNA